MVFRCFTEKRKGFDVEARDAVQDLIKNLDGLMLGICNGFQALIKLGLVPSSPSLKVA